MQIKNIVIKNIIYLLAVLLFSYYLTTVKFSSPLQPSIELIIQGENIEQQSGQIYCRSKNNKYNWKRRFEFSYDETTKIGDGLYKIKAAIPCSNEVTNLRFDPLPGSGEIYLKSLKFYGNVYTTPHCPDQFSLSFKI